MAEGECLSTHRYKEFRRAMQIRSVLYKRSALLKTSKPPPPCILKMHAGARLRFIAQLRLQLHPHKLWSTSTGNFRIIYTGFKNECLDLFFEAPDIIFQILRRKPCHKFYKGLKILRTTSPQADWGSFLTSFLLVCYSTFLFQILKFWTSTSFNVPVHIYV